MVKCVIIFRSKNLNNGAKPLVSIENLTVYFLSLPGFYSVIAVTLKPLMRLTLMFLLAKRLVLWADLGVESQP